MKKLLALALLVATTFLSCKKDDDNSTGTPSTGGGSSSLIVDSKIRPLFVDYTATWCGPCGQYGGPAFDATLAQEGTLMTAMKVYSTSSNPGMGHPFYSTLTSAFGVTGIPDFWVNNTSVNTNSSSVISSATSIQNDTAKLIAGVALNKQVQGDSLVIATKTKFFKSQTAGNDYYLAVYVVEDNVIGGQLVGSTQNANYDHRNVLRASPNSTYYGATLNSAQAITQDQVFDKTYKVYLNPAWNKSKLKAMAVIWKSGTNPYKVINSNVAK